MNRYRMISRGAVIPVLGAMLASVASFAKEPTDLPTALADYETATVTEAVPFAVDDTAAIAARNYLFPPFERVVPVPQIVPMPFQQRRGPRFHAEADPVREAFGQAPAAFPGPGISGLTPGDPNISAGPNHVICTINGQLAFYTKGGAQTFSVSPNTFFSSLGSYALVFDPRTVYDPFINRFWVMYAAYLSGSQGYWLVALSDDSDPNGNWQLWQLDASKNGNTYVSMWADYPGLGYNEDALYLTANMYGNYSGGKIRVMTKGQFVAGNPVITYTDFWNIANPGGGQAWSLQPARTLGFSHMPYVCNVTGGNRANIFGIQNVTTTPSLVSKGVPVPVYNGSVPNASQQGTGAQLWTVDNRIFDVHARDNIITFAHHVNVGNRCAIRCYELNATNMPTSASLNQSFTFSNASRDMYFGNTAMNGSGQTVSSFNRSGSAEYISIYYAGRLATDAPNTFGPQTLVTAGTVPYNGEGGNPVRWGDYNGLAIDPVDDDTFWGFQMLPNPAGWWMTEVFRINYGTPSTVLGHVTLGQWVGPVAGISGVMEFRTPATTTVTHKYPFTLDAGGNFVIPSAFTGVHDISLKITHWLRQTLTLYSIGPGVNGVNFTLTNGDATMDNTVALDDMNTVLTYFGTGNPIADLDGSGSVDLLDLNITLTNFGLSGDN